MSRYENTKTYIIARVKSGFSEKLYYHNLHHILDVLDAAENIARKENIQNHEMELLRVAVLFHDVGFIVNSVNHEEIGCTMVRESLPGFGYTQEEIDTICGMILATKYPHQPKNLLEEIICDADLDYLGRDDFFSIGQTLYRELHAHGIVSNEQEWNRMQEEFLNSHRYFTATAKGLRNARKQEHLMRIRETVRSV
jgi:uncharacterized protein